MKPGLVRNLSSIDGIWFPNCESARVSYSSSGHQECFEVENRSFWFSTRNEVIHSVLQLYPPSGTLFDVGGGNGVVSHYLQSRGIDVVLVEPGREGVRNAKQRGIHHIICGRFQDLEVSDELLPAIGLFDVIEHIEDDAEFLGAVADRLPESGRLYITVPTYQALWSDHDERAGHFRRYTIDSLSKVVSQSGFSIDFASYFFSPLPPFILAGRVIKERVFSLRTKDHREQKQLEHGNPLVSTLFKNLCKVDIAAISRGKSLPFGSSCIMAARRGPVTANARSQQLLVSHPAK